MHDTFGLLAFERYQDLPCKTVYETYKNRWLLELIVRQYKTSLVANQTPASGRLFCYRFGVHQFFVHHHYR